MLWITSSNTVSKDNIGSLHQWAAKGDVLPGPAAKCQMFHMHDTLGHCAFSMICEFVAYISHNCVASGQRHPRHCHQDYVHFKGPCSINFLLVCFVTLHLTDKSFALKEQIWQIMKPNLRFDKKSVFHCHVCIRSYLPIEIVCWASSLVYLIDFIAMIGHACAS